MKRHAVAAAATLTIAVTCLAQQEGDWQTAEAGILENHVQLTFPARFHKAGEAYFSPDDRRVIFQAVETPPEGRAPDQFYGMFVADVDHDATGRLSGLSNIRRLSPEGSANTCGWFHPTDRDLVVFASTVTPPTDQTPPGFERLSGRYRWMFPPEMRIVTCRISEADGTARTLKVIQGDGQAYQAEGSWSRDGRWLLFCSLQSNMGDLFVKDTGTGAITRIVEAGGYDGGPFFSPDGRRICYRSDRRGDHYLQLFVGHLAFDEQGAIVGLEREYQLTDNGAVNWCPYWHPGGRHLVYASSAVGHRNYEVFICDADPGNLSGSSGTIRYGIAQRRLTHAEGADVLPVFNRDGSIMMWTAQRDPSGTSQLWAADFVLDLD
ncbi:MAG: TolB family protein [Planctomycetota bacterium]|jgi:dipeptidyl aminopeptidase/acylaminoacyl peptidase